MTTIHNTLTNINILYNRINNINQLLLNIDDEYTKFSDKIRGHFNIFIYEPLIQLMPNTHEPRNMDIIESGTFKTDHYIVREIDDHIYHMIGYEYGDNIPGKIIDKLLEILGVKGTIMLDGVYYRDSVDIKICNAVTSVIIILILRNKQFNLNSYYMGQNVFDERIQRYSNKFDVVELVWKHITAEYIGAEYMENGNRYQVVNLYNYTEKERATHCHVYDNGNETGGYTDKKEFIHVIDTHKSGIPDDSPSFHSGKTNYIFLKESIIDGSLALDNIKNILCKIYKNNSHEYHKFSDTYNWSFKDGGFCLDLLDEIRTLRLKFKTENENVFTLKTHMF